MAQSLNILAAAIAGPDVAKKTDGLAFREIREPVEKPSIADKLDMEGFWKTVT